MTEPLNLLPAVEHPELLAPSVAAVLQSWNGTTPVDDILVVEIDPAAADTAACCERYGFAMEESANCVVVAAKRAGTVRFAACVVLATTRADVNTVVRRHLDARKASFAPMDEATSRSGMEYGGITPFGLPDDWPVLVDAAVISSPRVVLGSGLRRSKILAPGAVLADLKTAEVIEGLGVPSS